LRSGEMNKGLEDAAKGLKKGEVSGPIETDEGVYYIQLIDAIAPAPRPLESVRGEIYDRLFKKIMDERFNFWLSEVKKYAHIEIRL
ncbi:MAG: peptidyl-prolyl cis-trans isomerase, partial [Deltaproteobacteria bacterium]|nr:peptidyl-prolyl cis-trans isomerase [Deltaproteobacteria bacterium]